MTVKDYLTRPYHIVFQHISDESGSYYLTSVSEFDGCMCRGASYAEAFEKIQTEMEDWIEAKLANGAAVPEPSVERHYSGRLNLRVPKTLHASLALEAEKEGVSLNQYINFRLST